MTTDQKGAIAETAITAAAVKLGIDVYRPIAEGGRYDLIFAVASRLLRVQCKWVPLRREVVAVPFVTCRRGPNGFVRRVYTANEIDAVAAYCQTLDRCFWLPIEPFEGKPGVSLRVSPARNNQRLKINWADDFDFAARLTGLGAVAQLGEH